MKIIIKMIHYIGSLHNQIVEIYILLVGKFSVAKNIT